MRSLRVVLAEDGELLRAGILALLAPVPEVTVVGAASSLPTLLAVVERENPDVVLTDVRMPPRFSNEGIQAAAQLRRSRPELGVCVLTQYADVEYAIELIADGSQGRGYLLKERVADVDQLVQALRLIAQGGSVIDESIVSQLVAAVARRERSRVAALTPRERDVLGLVARGQNNAGIAHELSISAKAVEKHVGSIFAKLELNPETGMHRRVAATLLFLKEAGVSRSADVPRAW